MRLCFLGLFWSHSCTILGGFLFCCVFVVLVGSFLCFFLVVWLRFYLFLLLVNLFLLPCQCATGNGFPIEINAFGFCFSCYPAFLPSHHRGFCTDTEKIPGLGRPYNSCNNVLTTCVHLFAFLNYRFKFCKFTYSVCIF